jgi:hypothetical protein
MSSTSLSQPTRNEANRDSQLRKFFWGDCGLRSGWRLLSFLLLLVTFETGLRKTMVQVPVVYRILKAGQNGTISPQYELVFDTALITGMFLSAAIMSKIKKRSLSEYGLPLRSAFGKLFWQGVLWV